MKTIRCYATLLIILMVCSCEKFATESETPTKEEETQNNMTLSITQSEQVKETCQRLTFGVFNATGKVKSIHQVSTDTDFGIVHLNLPKDSYRIVAIGHNGKDNCTISSPEKITFANNKVTDTFSAYKTIEVAEEGNISEKFTLERAVGMFRLHIQDEIPTEAKNIKFYYTGGSSTFDATTGFGCVNSRQTEIMEMSPTQKDYDIYTFPHDGDKKLKITITVMDTKGNTLATTTLTDVSIIKNYITKYSGELFGTPSIKDDGNTQIDFRFDDKWAGEYTYAF